VGRLRREPLTREPRAWRRLPRSEPFSAHPALGRDRVPDRCRRCPHVVEFERQLLSRHRDLRLRWTLARRTDAVSSRGGWASHRSPARSWRRR
jgi:hypothetical protein